MSHDISYFSLRPKRYSRVLFFGAVFFLTVCATFVFFSVEVFLNIQDAMDALTRAKSHAALFEVPQTKEELDHAKDSLDRAQHAFQFLRPVEILPSIGTIVSQSHTFVLQSADLVESLKGVVDVGESILELSGTTGNTSLSFSDLPPQTKRLVLERIQTAARNSSVLLSQLTLIQETLKHLSDSFFLQPFTSPIHSVRDQLDATQSSLEHISRFALLVPSFAGIGTTHHHLILFLNNAELRPAGGFVGSYGILTVNNGDVQGIKTADVYTLDRAAAPFVKEPAPFPLQTYNETPVWFFRDANWSPDFSVSAQKLIETYTRELRALTPSIRASVPQADPVDGVIAFTPTFASQILDLVGPLVVDGQTFTQKNIADKLEYQVEYAYVQSGIPEAQRKEVIGDLVDAAVTKLSELPLEEWPHLMRVFENALISRQFFVFHSNPQTESILSKVDWAGRYAQKTVDIQLVVDANLASLKSDPVVERTISYEVFHNTVGELMGRTKIVYAHHGVFDWKTTRYRTYTRLYVPQGSVLVRASGMLKNDRIKNPNAEPGSVDISEELGMTVFGAFTSVEPGKTQTLTFEYRLSDAVKQAMREGTYGLTVFKQNGAENHRLTLDLDFDKKVVRATPPEEKSEWGDDRYRLNTILDQDRSIELYVE